MSPAPVPVVKKSFGPESDFWNKLKGKVILLKKSNAQLSVAVRLLWVDRYSIGVRYHEGTDRARDVLEMKSGIESVELSPSHQSAPR